MFADHFKDADELSPRDYDYNDKLSFMTIWVDYNSGTEKTFTLNYYPCDKTVELIDDQLSRVFLSRTNLPGIELRDMFIGNEVRIYGRQIKLTGYADRRTSKFIEKSHEHTVAVLKPEVLDQMGDIIKVIEDNQFRIGKLRMCRLTRREAMDFYEYLKEEPFASSLVENLCSGPIVAMELVGEDTIKRWDNLLGPSSPLEAKRVAPNSLRAQYGHDRASNALHGSLTKELAVREATFFFSDGISDGKISFSNSTCCVIKPHAIREGNLGRILTTITNSQFSITAMQMFYLNNSNAEDLLEVYKGVVGDYNALVESFLDGPCVALKISSKCGDMDVHGQFRNLCGPVNSDVAKKIRPQSIRGKFGVDKYKNAVHCTDLPDDTDLELELFFYGLNNFAKVY